VSAATGNFGRDEKSCAAIVAARREHRKGDAAALGTAHQRAALAAEFKAMVEDLRCDRWDQAQRLALPSPKLSASTRLQQPGLSGTYCNRVR
jgi:hypothetical protein